MEIIILGCGFSLGCPVLGCSCKQCLSKDKYNKRSRCAIVIKDNNSIILVDFGPDIRTQLIENKITKIDAIICTHDHYDHVAGLDELRIFASKTNQIPIYSNQITLDGILKRSNYLFHEKEGYGPFFTLNKIDNYEKISISNIDVQFFELTHGVNSSLGFRISDFVYSNDLTSFPEKTKNYLGNIENWVLDCIDLERTHAHCGLKEVLEWNEEFKPKQIFLTNLSHNLDYHEFKSILPKSIEPCFDGLKIRL